MQLRLIRRPPPARLLPSSRCVAAVTFVDSIVSGSEQKRRFVFTQNGGGEEARGRKEESLTGRACKDKIDPFIWTLAFSHDLLVTQTDLKMWEFCYLFLNVVFLAASGSSNDQPRPDTEITQKTMNLSSLRDSVQGTLGKIPQWVLT